MRENFGSWKFPSGTHNLPRDHCNVNELSNNKAVNLQLCFLLLSISANLVYPNDPIPIVHFCFHN